MINFRWLWITRWLYGLPRSIKKAVFLAEKIALPSCSFQEIQNSESDSTLKLSDTVDRSEILNNHSLDVKKKRRK